MLATFHYTSPLQRFVFEPGAVDKIAVEVRALGASRVMVVCGGNTRRSRLFSRVVEQLGSLRV